MKFLKNLLFIGAALSMIAAVVTFPVEGSYAAKAKFVQRVAQNEGDALFGEAGTPIGSPQMLIIEDAKAFTGEKTPEGAEIVSEKYLQDNKVYPLQLQTVKFVASNTRLGLSVAAILLTILGVWASRRLRSFSASPDTSVAPLTGA